MSIKSMEWNGWIARDKSGELYFYEDKPYFLKNKWYPSMRDNHTYGAMFLLTKHLNVDVSDFSWLDDPIEAVITFSLKDEMEKKKWIEVALKIISYLVAVFLGGAGTYALF